MSENEELKIPVVFIQPTEGAIGADTEVIEWFSRVSESFLKKLRNYFSNINFITYFVENEGDVDKVLKSEKGSTGYVLVILNSISGLVKPFLHSGKPVIMIAETYGGSGDFLLEYSRALKQGMPVVGVSAREVWSDQVISKIKLLKVIHELRNSKILFVVSESVEKYLRLEYPLSVALYSIINEIQATFGVRAEVMNARVFKENYYSRVSEEEAQKIFRKWVDEASSVPETLTEEILKSAKLYLAIKKALKDRGANAVAFDCIVLRATGEIDAWPCLAFMELWNDGLIPVCEADPNSAIAILIGKFLGGVNAFIMDPAIDTVNKEVIYYHCYAPLNPREGKERAPYSITPAHLGFKHASVSVKLPVNEVITALTFSIPEGKMILHTAEALRNESSSHACATKLVARTNTDALARNWVWEAGWHRAILYGDYRQELKELGKLLKLKVIEEDKP